MTHFLFAEMSLRRVFTVRTLGIAIVSLSLAFNFLAAAKIHSLRARVEYLMADGKVKVGQRVPPFTVARIDGVEETLRLDNAKTRTVLYVFSPSCGWCKRNIENVKALQQSATDYRLIGLSMVKKDLSAHVASAGFKFPIYSNIPPDIVGQLRLGGTPNTIIVSEAGTVLKSWVGAYSDTTKTEIESFLKIRLPGITLGN